MPYLLDFVNSDGRISNQSLALSQCVARINTPLAAYGLWQNSVLLDSNSNWERGV